MSLGRIFSVWCDSGATYKCRRWVAQEMTSKEARKAARRAGWKRRVAVKEDRFAPAFQPLKLIDVCPECTAATTTPGGSR